MGKCRYRRILSGEKQFAAAVEIFGVTWAVLSGIRFKIVNSFGGQDHITRNPHLALDNLLRCSPPHFPNISGYCCHKAQGFSCFEKKTAKLSDSPGVITKNRFCHLSPPT